MGFGFRIDSENERFSIKTKSANLAYINILTSHCVSYVNGGCSIPTYARKQPPRVNRGQGAEGVLMIAHGTVIIMPRFFIDPGGTNNMSARRKSRRTTVVNPCLHPHQLHDTKVSSSFGKEHLLNSVLRGNLLTTTFHGQYAYILLRGQNTGVAEDTFFHFTYFHCDHRLIPNFRADRKKKNKNKQIRDRKII